MAVRHRFQSAKADTADVSLVRPSNWNDEHLGAMSVVNAKTDYGASADGIVDDSAALAAAITATPTGGVLYLPGGTYLTGALVVDKRISIIGDGAVLTVLRAKAGATGPLLSVSPGVATTGVRIRGIGTNLTNAPAIDGLLLNNLQQLHLDDVAVTGGGAIGVHITNTGSSFLSGVFCRDQTTAFVQVDGDTSAELYYSDFDLSRGSAGTTAVGFEIVRTTATDLGGHYLRDVRVTRGAGTVTRSGYAHSSAPSTFFGIDMVDCVFDNANDAAGNTFGFLNASAVRVMNSWFNNNNLAYAVKISGGGDYQFMNCWIDGGAGNGGVEFLNAPNVLQFVGCRFPNGTAFKTTAGQLPTNIFVGPNSVETAWATSPTALLGQRGVIVQSMSPVFLTDGGGGAIATLTIRDVATATEKYLRVSNGTLQVMPTAFGAPILSLTDAGALTVTGIVTIPSGSAAAPGLVVAGSPTTGLFQSASNILGIAANGLLALEIGANASAVNNLRIRNSATGAALFVSAVGTDTDISIQLNPKGAGGVILGNGNNQIEVVGVVSGSAPIIEAIGSSDVDVDIQIAAKGAGVLDIRTAAIVLGGGAAPTFGTIGGSGPTAAAQNRWGKLKFNGTTYFVPLWV